jgi:hypothetical protein
VKVKQTIRTGIDIDSPLGLVPLYHEVNACNEANYQYDTTWQELSRSERAFHVARYYVKILVDNHQQDAQNEHLRKLQRKGKRGR